MEDNMIRNDSDIASGVLEGTNIEEIQAAVRSLNKNNIQYIAKYYSKLKTAPTYGELRMYGEILERRRTCAEGRLISSLDSDIVTLMETYKDMTEKAEALMGSTPDGLALHECASVLGEYMRMIGRYDCRSYIQGAHKDGLSILCDGEAVMSLGAGAPRNKKRTAKNKAAYSVMLTGGDTQSVAFLSDKRVRSLCRWILKVGEFGIIGVLSHKCEGARIDLSSLGDEISPLRLVSEEHKGKYLVLAEPDRAQMLLRLADSDGIAVTPLGLTDNSRYIKIHNMNIPTELVRDLMDSQRAASVSVSENPSASLCRQLPIFVGKNGECEADISDILLKSKERLISAIRIAPERNSFSSAVNAATDGILRLVAAGVDRRAIAIASVYELQRKVSALDLGEDLAMILGVYRIGIEFALSDGYTQTKYGDKRSLCLALYASAPRTRMSAVFTGSNSDLGVLPVGEINGEFSDFAYLRRICDDFTRLCKRGVILSARAVTDEPSVTIKAMEGKSVAELSDNGKIIANTPGKGILFESTVDNIKGIIGELRALSV